MAPITRKESRLVRTAEGIGWELSVSGSRIGEVTAEIVNHHGPFICLNGNPDMKILGKNYLGFDVPFVVRMVSEDLRQVADGKYPNYKITPVLYNGQRYILTSQIT